MLFYYVYISQKELYFDNNANTQMHSQVAKAIYKARKLHNPDAYYAFTEQNIIADFKTKILRKLGKPNHKVIITASCSEANNLLFNGLKHVYHTFCSNFEHKTSIECVNTVFEYSNVLNIDFPQNSLVSIMAVNNETGDILPVDSIARNLKSKNKNIIIHSDIAQYFGKMVSHKNILDLDYIDCFSISFHKMHGPLGVAVLVLPEALETQLQSIVKGVQNNNKHGGSYNIQSIVGANICLDITLSDRVRKNNHLYSLTQYFKNILKKYRLEIPQNYFNKTNETQSYISSCKLKQNAIMFIHVPSLYHKNDVDYYNPFNTVLVSFINNQSGKRFCNINFRKLLAEKNIKVSIGSACNTSRKGASHVLLNLKLPFIVRCGVIRFSFSDYTSFSDLDLFEKRCKFLLL